MRIRGIFGQLTRNSSGFALLEAAVGLSILSLGVVLIGTSVFQVLSIQRNWLDDRVATKDLRHTGSWFAGDALNAETVVIAGTPEAPTVTISWVDSSDVFHSSIYSLDGDTLIRDDDGIVTPVAKSVVSADFSLSGRVLTLDLTVNSGNSGTTPLTLQTYLRDLQS